MMDKDDTLSSLRLRGKTKSRTIDDEMSLADGTSISDMMVSQPSQLQYAHLSTSLKHIFLDMSSIDFTDNPEGISAKIRKEESNTTFNFGSEAKLKQFIKKILETEFPKDNNTPTASDVIQLGDSPVRARYGPGTWVEVKGPDMKWRLDIITKVAKQAPDDWDWNDAEEDEEPKWVFHYHAGGCLKFREEDVRSSEEGLKRVFGNGPWIWQQWAMLKLEQKLRFQEGHTHDFIELDVQKYGSDLWNQWLEHPSNLKFKDVFYDERVGSFGRSELVKHILTPFHLIDKLKADKDEWDFGNDEHISIFTYMSFLGAGSFIPLLVFLLQLSIPIVLFFSVVNSDSSRCSQTDDSDKMMVIVVVLYLITVIPETFARLYDVEGAANNVYSRLLSLRRELWDQGDDGVIQMIGYKLDRVMNTGYESALLILNLIVISYADTAMDVLLNALAFVFVAKIDEEIVKSSWWDPNNRWIIAGAIEVVMAKTIRFRSLASPEYFSERYGISKQSLMDACDEDENLFKNEMVAKCNMEDAHYLTKEEQVQQHFRNVALETGNIAAIREYEKPMAYCGIIETLLGPFLGANPIFMDFKSYRTWSRWNIILYLAPVPDLDELFDAEMIEDTHVLKRSLDFIVPTKENPFANFYPLEDGLSKREIFIRHVIDVLKNDVPNGIRTSCRKYQEHIGLRFIVHFLSGFLNILIYFFVLVFPLLLVLLGGLLLFEIFFEKCTRLFEEGAYFEIINKNA